MQHTVCTNMSSHCSKHRGIVSEIDGKLGDSFFNLSFTLHAHMFITTHPSLFTFNSFPFRLLSLIYFFSLYICACVNIYVNDYQYSVILVILTPKLHIVDHSVFLSSSFSPRFTDAAIKTFHPLIRTPLFVSSYDEFLTKKKTTTTTTTTTIRN